MWLYRVQPCQARCKIKLVCHDVVQSITVKDESGLPVVDAASLLTDLTTGLEQCRWVRFK